MDTFYTNADEKFDKIKKIRGVIGTIEDKLVFKRTDTEANTKYGVTRLNTYLFLAKKYWWVTIVVGLLFAVYLYKYKLYALLLVVLTELYLYKTQPFKTYQRAKNHNKIITWTAIALFLVSGYFLFGSLENMRERLSIIQALLYGTMLFYARFHIEGIINKYREIYILNKENKNQSEYTEVYIWRKTI